MKTATRARLLAIVAAKGGARPVELVEALGLTPQAVHRHLKALLAAGVLERRGGGPLTRYFIAGAPLLDRARRWYASKGAPGESPSGLVCETRDAFSARLGRLAAFKAAGLDEKASALAIAAAGEVGNNCFDHNLGSWRDVPGCWFEAQATGKRLWIVIADRGQGVFKSLTRADLSIPDEQAALVAAFERTLSGRAPESRGNGLKFVRNIVTGVEGRGLACRSGVGVVDYGSLGGECRTEAARFAAKPGGTVTLLLWSLK